MAIRPGTALCNLEGLRWPCIRTRTSGHEHNESIASRDLSRMTAKVGAKGHGGGAQHRELSMSGYLRLCLVSLVLVETLSTAPASSNPLVDIFNTAAPPPATISPPQAECVRRPSSSTPDGQHWVYRMDGHRKCWFLTEATGKVKKTVRRPVAKDSTASLDERGTARPRQNGVVDARGAAALRTSRAASAAACRSQGS